MTTADQRFLIDCITTDIIARLMEEEQLDMQTAMQCVLHSRTYALLCDAESGLVWQSPEYVYEYLKEETPTLAD